MWALFVFEKAQVRGQARLPNHELITVALDLLTRLLQVGIRSELKLARGGEGGLAPALRQGSPQCFNCQRRCMLFPRGQPTHRLNQFFSREKRCVLDGLTSN